MRGDCGVSREGDCCKEQGFAEALFSSLLLLKRLYRVRSVKLWQSNTNPTLGCQGGEDVRRERSSTLAIDMGGNFGEETTTNQGSRLGLLLCDVNLWVLY